MEKNCAQLLFDLQSIKNILSEISASTNIFLDMQDNPNETKKSKIDRLARIYKLREIVVSLIEKMKTRFVMEKLFDTKYNKLEIGQIKDMLEYIYEKSIDYAVVSKTELSFLYRLNRLVDDKLFHIFSEPDDDFRITGNEGRLLKTKIYRIFEERNEKADLASITGYPIEQIGQRGDDSGDKKYYYGDLNIHKEPIYRHVKLPDIIDGSLSFSDKFARGGIKLPLHVSRNLRMMEIESADGVIFPDSVGKDIDLTNLRTIDGLILPHHVGGYVRLLNLSSADREAIKSKYPNLKFEF